jgi:hypothetical protein
MSASVIALALCGMVIQVLTGRAGVADRTDSPPPAEPAPPLSDLTPILAKARAAVAYENLKARTGGLLLEGDWEEHELKGRFSLQFTPRGQFRRRIDTRLKDLVAFDGVTGWGVDTSGMPRILEMDDLEATQTLVWVLTGRWLAEDGPFSITVAPAETTDRRIGLRLRLKAGVKDAHLILDRSTGLPLLLRWPWHVGEETWEFHDYRKTLGVVLAHKVVRTSGRQLATSVIRRVSEVRARGEEAYKPMLTRPDDTRFDRAVSASVPIQRVVTGHLFVRPKINGRDVGWFALDTGTGAGMTIAPSAADDLHLPCFGKVVSVGAGKTEATAFRQAATFELGPVTITGTTYVEMPPALVDLMSKSCGLPVAGTCGYDLFSRVVAVLDWEAKKLELHDPDRYQSPEARWEPLSLNHKIPCIRCQFEDKHEGLFRLDTGCPIILFHSPAVERLKLLEGRSTKAVRIGGAGGFVDARFGTLASFVVAGHRFPKPQAEFTLAKDGALAEAYTLGTFGGPFLAPFQLVLDYPHRRLGFIEKRQP